jgi:hypothetical protein
MIQVRTVAGCAVLIGALGGLPLSTMQARAQDARLMARRNPLCRRKL